MSDESEFVVHDERKDALAYLDAGLVVGTGLRTDLQRDIDALATGWVEQGTDPGSIEMLSEFLARLADQLGDHELPAKDLREAVAWLELDDRLLNFIGRAVGARGDAQRLAALSLHLLDIAEAAALRVYVPELPSLTAKSDRTGDAARSVGTARYLRG